MEAVDGVHEPEPGRPSNLTGNAVSLYGKPGKLKYITQSVASIGHAGDAFVAGGWSWNQCRPRNDAKNSRYKMEILARPNPVDVGLSASQTASFRTVGRVRWSEEWSGWQFAAAPIVMPWRYTEIMVKLVYQNNLNMAQFSNLFLHKEEFGKTYAYDDKGNVTSVKNLAALQSGATYDDFDNLISYHQPGRSEKYTLDWGSSDDEKKKHLLHSMTSPLNIVHRTTYDTRTATAENPATTLGLPEKTYTEATFVNDEGDTCRHFIAAETGYTTDKNYASTSTDARKKVVTTVTDPDRGIVNSVTDPKGQTVAYKYDDLNRTTMVYTASDNKAYLNQYVYTGEVTYDAHNNLARFEETVGVDRTAYSTAFSYDEENKPTLLQYNDSSTDRVAYAYDELGRMAKRTVTVNDHACETNYGYVAGTQTYTPEKANDDTPSYATTGLIESISQPGGNFTYDYDDNGNITRVKQGDVETTYTYDALGQLIRVNDQNDTTSGEGGTTWVYEYDQGGNILFKKRYGYTKPKDEITDSTEVLETVAFSYTNTEWKDQLTKVGDKTITYDNIGNPKSDGTWTYIWEKGRQLARMHNSEKDVRFKYNESGLRIQKVLNPGTANEEVTNYTLHGKNIVHMTKDMGNQHDSLHFFYDASNKPAIVEFNGTKYAYVYNLQGDIVAILDSKGTAVVKYKYDAWGRQIKCTFEVGNDDAEALSTLNPFRYRGYVYDEETELYYLRSRFYSYTLLRFLNADALVKAHMYAYCRNNPMCYSDADGYESTPDYTRMLNSELDRIIAFTDPSLFIQDEPNDSISFAIAHLPTYWYLLNTMQDGDQFDYKDSAVWSERFPSATVGANGEEFIFRGMKMKSENFGNFAYGYYCTALGLPKEHILQAAGAYKVGKNQAHHAGMTFMEYITTRGGINHIVDQMCESEMKKWDERLTYPNEWYGGNEREDHGWIVKGIYECLSDFSD